MRKVVVMHMVKVDLPTPENPRAPAHYWEKAEKGEAVFHQFSTDHEEFEDGPGNYPAAIIEWPDGQLESVHVNFLRFVDPTTV